MQSKFMIRQGDVLVFATETVPADLKPIPRDAGRVILAYGEVTGHAHALVAPGVEFFGADGADTAASVDRYLRCLATEGATLNHEEHSTITIPQGNYTVRIQREYSPEAIRLVAD